MLLSITERLFSSVFLNFAKKTTKPAENKRKTNPIDRCHILSKMVKVFEISSSFSEKDAHDLMSLLDQMAKSVINTSETEIELGIKTRLAEKKNLEASAFRKNYEISNTLTIFERI